MNDLLKTQMQETGECCVQGLTVLEIADIVESLGLDARAVRIFGGGNPPGTAYLTVCEDRLMGLRSVTLR